MAKVYLDTKIFIDIAEERKDITLDGFLGYELTTSPLSIHILFYVAKRKVPYQKVAEIIESLVLVPFDRKITAKALEGPTADFEDNVQLHSCTTADCDLFLTKDKKLLKMKFFGKAKIVSRL